ncbi:MAG: GlsB/YeaQ/YmgE family stress response membrane protein [Candidatus Andersenbacteria bacterium]
MIWQAIIFLVIGALAGWLAGVVVRGAGFGLLGNIIVGIIGALVGGFVFRLFGFDPTYGFIGSVITATIGAIIVLGIVVLVKRA